jgi:hypothetical protein
VVVRFATVSRTDDPQFEQLAAEGFLLRNVPLENHRELVVLSTDAAGAMYGGLELAEQIRVHGVEGVRDTDRNPYLPLRGTKFNIPLDLRTPSYTDMGDSAQANIATVWDFGFWRQYLDQLARDRYNMVSLWNLHPFPSMVRVPEYPDIALDDVWRSRAKFDEDYSTRTTDIVTPAMLADKEVVRKLGVEEKIEFWRRVMQYAHDRNIAVYVVTWNVYTYGTGGRYGITDALDNPRTVDYFRASVRAMFRTYPLLAGIGLTAGENMGDASAYYRGSADSFEAKENWLMATYGQGVLDAARAEPQRQFRLIHRQHESRAQDIAQTFQPVIAQPNVDFVFSFKYAQAPRTVVDHAEFPPRLPGVAGRPAHALDHPQRRCADAALGRAGFRARLREEHSVPEVAGLLLRVGHVGVGTRVPVAPSAETAPAGDRQALAALPAVGTARLRPDARRRAHRGTGGAAFPGRGWRETARRLAGRFDDLSVGDWFSLGQLRLPVVHRGLPQPAGAREDRERVPQRRDLHQPAGASWHR